jgi:hypothetical protein
MARCTDSSATPIRIPREEVEELMDTEEPAPGYLRRPALK